MSVPVVLVSGLHAEARSALVDRLLADHPGSVAVHHDLREVTMDRVERLVRDVTGVLDRQEIRLAHGCVTCTVREDLIPQLISRTGSAPLLIAELWDSVEPQAPEVFDQGADDGLVVLLDRTPPSSLRGAVRKAARQCPSGAVAVHDSAVR